MTISTRTQITLLFLLGVPALLNAGCREWRRDQVQTSFGVSGSANPGGDSRVSETVPETDADLGGRGLTDTRGTSVTGALPGAGSPEIGETGNLLTPSIGELGGTGNAPAARAPEGAASPASSGAARTGEGGSGTIVPPVGGAAEVPPLSPAGDKSPTSNESVNPLHHSTP